MRYARASSAIGAGPSRRAQSSIGIPFSFAPGAAQAGVERSAIQQQGADTDEERRIGRAPGSAP